MRLAQKSPFPTLKYLPTIPFLKKTFSNSCLDILRPGNVNRAPKKRRSKLNHHQCNNKVWSENDV